MLCPKCKKEIPDNSLKCSFCEARVGLVCQDCGTYNPITSTECINCNKTLIKICSECKAANLPSAKYCRKCHIEFIQNEEKSNNINSENLVPMNSQQKIKAKLIEGIKDSEKKIITVSGPSGCGKNLVIRHTINNLKNAKLIWLYGSCTQNTQLSPFGYFQDVLLSFFNINNFCPDTLQLKKNSIKFFKQDFPTLSTSEITDLLNFLYPEITDKYENIYYNKAKFFTIIKKVILTIVEKLKVIFIVDSFEHIDGMSFDFLRELLQEEIILERSKVILVSTEPKPGLGLITTPNLTPESYLDLTIAPFTESQVETMLKQYANFKFGKDFTKFAMKISAGNPSIIEQMVLYKTELIKNKLKTINYNNYETLVQERLNLLKGQDIKSYRMLIAMSILGTKFYPAILESLDNNTPSEFEQILYKLVDCGFITQLNNLTFEFKSKELWKLAVYYVKNDESFEEILNQLYEILAIYKHSSIAMLGYILQKLNNNDKAFDVWTQLMKHACYIGDIGLYIITQKQALKLIENKTSPYYLKIKKNIYTRVGKILEPIDHKLAFEYLQNAIMLIEDYEDNLHIELLSYLASCSMKTGNYWGAIECIDNVLNKIPDEMNFEKTLVKSRQVTPYLKLGNYGQVINVIETEILPEIEKYLSKGKDTNIIKVKDLFDLWIGIYFDFAEALTFQGDNKCFEVIQNIYDILDKNQTTEPTLICKTNLLLALANSVKGDVKTSQKILDDILKEYSLDNMDSFIVSRWNFIDILNKFLEKNYNTLYSELFNVAAYANNINDNFTKNILKTILAKILKDNNQTKKALEILEEQVSYFANEKVATGVLLSWYLIAEIKLITNGTQFALDIATKALDIAQGPSINNYYFITLFNKLIGEIYLAKQDFESAKVYMEKAIFLAKQFDLEYILVKTYLLCAKLYQELALPKTGQRGEYIKQALKMFQLAKNIGIVAEQPTLQKEIREELAILSSFCKLNGIILKKENK